MADAGGPIEPVERKPWASGVAPAYIGTFLWMAFFDGLGRHTLPVGGLIPTLLGVVAASILAYLLLYRVPATWGYAAGRPLDVVASSTFGISGARIVPNVVVAVGQVGLFAVGIDFATDLNLTGLLRLGLIEPQVIRPVVWAGRLVPAPLFLTVALVWGVITALVGLKIVKWIAAIMQYFPIFPAAALAIVMVASFMGLRTFQPTGIDPSTGAVVALDIGARLAFLGAFQWTFGFASLLGIAGADWGAASLGLADVRKGGWIGVTVAPVVVASLALLAVAGNEGRIQNRIDLASAAARTEPGAAPPRRTTPILAAAAEPDSTPERYTFRAAIEGNVDRRIGAGILIVFGLASLAPACYAAYEFGRRLASFAPGISKVGWTLVGVACGWFLIVGGWFERTDVLFSILGALFAPVAGAMVADSSRQRGAGWPGPRPGFNLAGLLAWLMGGLVGIVPTLAPAAGLTTIARIPAAALLAFVVAFVVYRGAALIGLEPKVGPPDQVAAHPTLVEPV